MKPEHQVFYTDVIQSIQSQSFALFAGAGLSMPAGFVDWKGLLKEAAEELGVDIAVQDDLITLAQDHVDLVGGRGVINQTIIDRFASQARPTANHKVLARLNVRTFWTTNFDSLIEESLRAAGREPHVKHTASQLAQSKRSSQATVYKMHGDASIPHETILTKQDFDDYIVKREAFLNRLVADLIDKTFLFVGISFNDPNVLYVLQKVHQLLGQAKRRHWYFIKKVASDENQREAFEKAKEKQHAFTETLKQFGLTPVWIDDYSEITTILEEIETKLIEKEFSDIAHCYDDFQAYHPALSALLEKYPTNVLLLDCCAHYYGAHKQYVLARNILEKHLALEPENAQKHNHIGAVLHNYFKEYKEAEKHFFKALLLDADFELAHCNLANNFYALANFDSAQHHYGEALRIEEEYADAHAGLGRTLLALQNYEGANLHYNRAIELDESNAISYHNRAILYHKHLRKFDLAKTDFEKALALAPDLVESHLGYGTLLLERFSQPLKARQHFEKALRLDQNNYKPHFLIGLAIARDELDPIGARVKLEIARDLNPDSPLTQNHLGVELFNAFEREAAKACFERAIELDRADGWAYYNLGSVYALCLKDYTKAAELYEKAIELGQKTYEVYINLAIINNTFLKNAARATELFKKLIAFLPNRNEAQRKRLSNVHYLLGSLHAEKKKYKNARRHMEKAIELDPSNAQAKGTMAMILNNGFKDYTNAKRYAEEVISLLSESAVDGYNYATILHNLGEGDAALKAIENTLERFSSYMDAYVKKAQIYIFLKRFRDALNVLEQGLALDPSNVGLHYELVELLAKNLKDFDKALNLMENFLDIDPDKVRAFATYGHLIHRARGRMANRDRDKTVRLVERGIQYSPKSFESIFEAIAINCYKEKAFQDALFYQKKALEYHQANDSHYADSFELMAIWLVRHGSKLSEAKDYFFKSIAIHPHAYTVRNLGLTLQDMGQVAKAKKCYKLALRLDPSYKKAQESLDEL